MVEYNTIILGAGISGISCAIYLKRAGISTLIIENNIPGGQLNKATVIENYPGYVSIEGSELAGNLLSQVETSGVEILYDEITYIDYDKKIVVVNDKKYGYNNLGVAAIIFNRKLKRKNKYYCSEFVKYLVDVGNVDNNLPDIVKPQDFQNIDNVELIYKGKLRDFNKEDNSLV